MKLALSFAALLCSWISAVGQQSPKAQLLVGHPWVIKSHTMTGIGIHHSTPEENGLSTTTGARS